MPVRHIEGEMPMGDPPAEAAGYATIEDVQAFNAARVLSATSIPNTAQVERFIQFTAAEIDAILVEKGYQLPVATTATGALLFLAAANAKGAWAMTERSAQVSPHLKEAETAWEEAKAMLRAADQILEASKDAGRSSPRGPGQTEPPGYPTSRKPTFDPNEYGYGYGTEELAGNDPLLPYFSRRMRF